MLYIFTKLNANNSSQNCPPSGIDSCPTRRFKSTFSLSSLMEEGFAPILVNVFANAAIQSYVKFSSKNSILTNIRAAIILKTSTFLFRCEQPLIPAGYGLGRRLHPLTVIKSNVSESNPLSYKNTWM